MNTFEKSSLKSDTPYQAISPSIHWAQYHERSPSFKWSRRIYDFEILYLQQGEIQVTFESESFIASTGTLLYIPSDIHHTIKVITNPYACFLGVHFDFFDELNPLRDDDIIVDEDNVNPNQFGIKPNSKDYIKLSFPITQIPEPIVVTSMENIINEFTLKKTGYQLICKGLLLLIIGHLIRGQIISNYGSHSKYKERIVELTHIMENEYGHNWTSREIGNYLNIDTDYAIKLFREVIGVTPNKYLQFIRHQRAKKLLRETNWKLEVISEKLGYEDLHYFSRIFRKWEGMSASNYRKFSNKL